MEREREGIDNFFRGFGFHGSMFPSLFGGRDPFADPFFSSQPFGNLFESTTFGHGADSSDKLENPKEKGVLIEELGSDEEGQEDEGPVDDKENGTKHFKCKEPAVEHPDDAVDERESKNVAYKNAPYKAEGPRPQNHSYSFQSCKVTYGGVDGAYYSSTRTRRAGGDGVVVEETKEADRTTRQASHRISRGIHDKGHSVTRKLNADGRVDTLQTLHNLNEDELSGFEEAWNFNHKGDIPSWKHDSGFGRSEQNRDAVLGGRLLPSSEEVQMARGTGFNNEARTMAGRTKKVVRINIE